MTARLPIIPISLGLFALLYVTEILIEAATR